MQQPRDFRLRGPLSDGCLDFHRNAGAFQDVADQLQPDQRVVQLHQALLEIDRHGQQFAPAVGHPAAVVEQIRRLQRHLVGGDGPLL